MYLTLPHINAIIFANHKERRIKMKNSNCNIPLELQFPCPECGKTVSLSVEKANDPFTCPHCGKSFPLPDNVKDYLPSALESIHLYRNAQGKK